MKRHRTLCVALAMIGLVPADPQQTRAQVAAPSTQSRPAPAARPSSLELALLRSLQANPLTAAYLFSTETRGKQVVLRGRVGTKQVHDVAIQTALALGVPVVDDLIIDTAAAHQAASYPNPAGFGPGVAAPGYAGSGWATQGANMPGFPGAGAYGVIPYTYPQPILGRLDDPFYGFEPPAIGYPPWWGALTARRLGPQNSPVGPAMPNSPPSTLDPSTGAAYAQPVDPAGPSTGSIPFGTIDMAIDPRGVATLRGTVPSLAERITIGQRVAQTPGVSEVINLLNIQAAAATSTASDTPPPPPTPANLPRAPKPEGLAEGPPIAVDSDPVAQRAARSIASRSALAGLPIRVRVKDGVAALSGKVPTVYEAMLAYRSIQQTPGVREVEDRLEFVVPDGSSPNPLVEKGRPEDVEPYLEAQIRRQVGDLAHVDRVRVQGSSLDLRGTLGREEDRDRFDAILRSMPILRGFRLTAEVPAETR